MYRLLLAAFAATVTFSAAAYAADPQIVVSVDRNPQITHHRIVAAAEQLCESTMGGDPDLEFYAMPDCVKDTVNSAHYVGQIAGSDNKTFAQSAN
jgi:hypothetical protein